MQLQILLETIRDSTTSLDLMMPADQVFSPVVLDRYPPQDYTNATVDPMIPDFCMPLGVSVENIDTIGDENDMPPVRSHQFTLTVGDGSKVYGSRLFASTKW